jgi:hypothetical protein
VKHLSYATLQGKLLALPANIRLGWNKYSSLLRKFVNYAHKTFYNIRPSLCGPFVSYEVKSFITFAPDVSSSWLSSS